MRIFYKNGKLIDDHQRSLQSSKLWTLSKNLDGWEKHGQLHLSFTAKPNFFCMIGNFSEFYNGDPDLTELSSLALLFLIAKGKLGPTMEEGLILLKEIFQHLEPSQQADALKILDETCFLEAAEIVVDEAVKAQTKLTISLERLAQLFLTEGQEERALKVVSISPKSLSKEIFLQAVEKSAWKFLSSVKNPNEVFQETKGLKELLKHSSLKEEWRRILSEETQESLGKFLAASDAKEDLLEFLEKTKMDPTTFLFPAVATGALESLRGLLRKGADVCFDLPSQSEMSRQGAVDVLNTLVEEGVQLDAILGRLLSLTDPSKEEYIDKLLELGASPMSFSMQLMHSAIETPSVFKKLYWKSTKSRALCNYFLRIIEERYISLTEDSESQEKRRKKLLESASVLVPRGDVDELSSEDFKTALGKQALARNIRGRRL